MVLLRKYIIVFISVSVTELRANLDHELQSTAIKAPLASIKTGYTCTVPEQWIQPNT